MSLGNSLKIDDQTRVKTIMSIALEITRCNLSIAAMPFFAKNCHKKLQSISQHVEYPINGTMICMTTQLTSWF